MAGLGDRENLGVCGGISGSFNPVMGRGGYLAIMLDDRANWNFILLPSLDSLIVGQLHVEEVIALELRWVELFKRATQMRRVILRRSAKASRKEQVGAHNLESKANLLLSSDTGAATFSSFLEYARR